MKRALCIWLPHWPLQRLAAARAELSDRAVVLYELHASGGAKVVASCPRLGNAAAARWAEGASGIRVGMPLAEATALAFAAEQPLHLEPADPLADRLAIEAVAEWCGRFSPAVGLEETAAAESLWLDVTGLGALSGGEEPLARQVVRAFGERGWTARVAVADTLGAAWAVAHFAPLVCDEKGEQNGADPGSAILSALAEPLIVPPGETARALAPLPVAALRLADETVGLLAELGLRRIEQVAALRRETLRAVRAAIARAARPRGGARPRHWWPGRSSPSGVSSGCSNIPRAGAR